MSVWFVTGAARGLGAEITRQALTRGHQVVATARNKAAVESAFPAAGSDLLAVSLDVTSPSQAQQAVAAATAAFGTIDVLVNNAGRGLLGAVEEATDAEVRSVYDTNVFGLLTVIRAVTPVLRAQHSGSIVNISSVGGFAGSPGWGVYCSTKFAVEGLSEALAAELEPLGVQVTIIEPGYFRTDFLDASSLVVQERTIDDYRAGRSGQMRDHAGRVNHQQPGDPVKGARVIVETIDSGRAPLRLILGRDTLDVVENKIAFVRGELEQWRTASSSTDHDDVAAPA